MVTVAAIVFTALAGDISLKRFVNLQLDAGDEDVVGGDDLEGLDDAFELPSSTDVVANEVFKNAVDSRKRKEEWEAVRAAFGMATTMMTKIMLMVMTVMMMVAMKTTMIVMSMMKMIFC